MSKIDKVVLDRASDTSGRILELQELHSQTVKRLNRLDAQIDELITANTEANLATIEVKDLVDTGVIVSEIPVDVALDPAVEVKP